MTRYTTSIAMHHGYLESLLCSFEQKLCVALHCPEKMRGRDLKHREE